MLGLGERLAGSGDREEVLHGRADQGGPRRAEGEQTGVVDPLADESEDVLFGVGRRVFLNPVPHAPRQGRDVATDGGGGDSRIKGRDIRGERSSSRVSDAADLLGVDLGKRNEVIDAAHAVPDSISREAHAKKFERVSDDGVFGATDAVTAFFRRRVPKLAPLPLSHGIISQHDETALGEGDVELLIFVVSLAVGRMPARAEDRRDFPFDFVRAIQKGRDEIAREAFDGELLDRVVVGLDPPGFLDVGNTV